MLIDDKFIALSLPRCASTSFYITCLRNNIKVEHYDEEFYKKWGKDIDLNLDNEKLADIIVHGHESIVDLRKKFGYNHEVIAIRRDRHSRFISLWKHVIDLSKSSNSPLLHARLEDLELDDIMFYEKDDLVSEAGRVNIVSEFIMRNKLESDMNGIVKTMLYIFITPISEYHNHDPKIIWFDFNKLWEMEEWVSNKLGREFKLERSNGSQHYKCNLELDEKFIERYNSIYDYYDIKKETKTLI